MGFTKSNLKKDYVRIKRKWWNFWKFEELAIFISKRYDDAWKEVVITKNGSPSWGLELEDWVKDDIRQKLKSKCLKHHKYIKRSKKLIVEFYTWRSIQFSIKMEFHYHDGEIYLNNDKSLKRQKILESIGI